MSAAQAISSFKHVNMHTFIYATPTFITEVFCLVEASLSKPHTGGNQFNRGTNVAFPKAYAMSTESPTTVVVYSTVVRTSITFPKVFINGMERFAV